LLQAQKKYGKAEPYLRQALAMYEKLCPPAQYPQGHPLLANSLNNLGTLLQYQRKYGPAQTYYRKALAMREQLYPKAQYPRGHPLLAQSLNNLGSLLQDQGEYPQAQSYYRRALAMNEQLYPKAGYPRGHPDLAQSLNNLGSLPQAQGEYGQAEVYHRQALAMAEKLYPKTRFPQGYPLLATCLTNLGAVLRDQGEYGQAEVYYRQALAMDQQLYPKARYAQGHPQLATGLNNLGFLLQCRGKYGPAETFYRQALAMREKLYPKVQYPQGHPQLSTSLSNLGALLRARREYGQAEVYYCQSLAMDEKLYPKARYPQGHPDLACSLYSLGLVLWARGKEVPAERQLRQSLAMYQDLGRAFADTAAEAQALNFLARLPAVREIYLAYTAGKPPSAGGHTYALLWRGKAALTRVLEGRHRLLRAAGPDPQRKVQALLAIRTQLAVLLLAPADGRDKDHPQRLRRLTRRKEELEKELARSLPELARRKELATASPAALVRALPRRATFIDLLRYRTWEVKKHRWGLARYTAFVLARDRSVRRVELGPAAPIEQALARWRQDIARNLTSTSATKLRRLLWLPLAKHLPKRTATVYLSPDGALSAVPWAALPGRKKGTVLLEEYAFALVPHGPFLLEQLRYSAPRQKAGVLLALGGVRYDRDPRPLKQPPKDLPALRAPERGSKTGPWPYLPGTARELDRVADLAGRHRPAPRLARLSGARASAAEVLARLPQARWAHLATHGFFAAPRSATRQHLYDRRDFLRGLWGERRGAAARSPLAQSGLVLAGANRKGQGGILTAEVIVGLNLAGLELAVLSACETGLGEAATGEGVFGLQRAFHLAGTRTVVASLWRVDDRATAALMTLFYHHLWQKHLPPLQALRQAQLALYRHPEAVPALARSRGPAFDQAVQRVARPPAKGKGRKGHAPIKHWAAFTLSGAGR
jgi:CHAT domain-containing protein/tetratricopeptide (TPR) repeat protein